MERQPEYPPEFDEDPPCAICGRESGDCPCPECGFCGEQGRVECIAECDLKPSLRRCEPCNGIGAVLEVLNDWFPGGDVLEPEYGGPMVCQRCNGRGEFLEDWHPKQSITTQSREPSLLENELREAEKDLRSAWERNATAEFCSCCGGRFARESECIRCNDEFHTHYKTTGDPCPYGERKRT